MKQRIQEIIAMKEAFVKLEKVEKTPRITEILSLLREEIGIREFVRNAERHNANCNIR